ncbi:hypothetical protein Rhopal_007405-T1 [Rhodotorula paludigena]|uniref:Proteophosphoglycan 5 n=1 Tax=Rhodotorula paludigena TaxID=86838 RepID=A0AAV5GXV3_9BASI|nr:hypothetical protein Rhopal_007405-T1 [Rhodotorula paludigena]
MTTTIASLPFELLEQILSHTVEDCDLESAKSAAARAAFLRDCALVSRSFRCPAQAVLWASLRVHSPAQAKRLLASPVLGQYGTRELDVTGVHSGVEGLSGTTAARVLGKIKGVKVLRLADFGRLSARVLQNENLAGLTTLILSTSFPDKPATIAALRFPFHLRTLHLFNRSYGPSILPALLSASAHSLTSLTLLTSSGSPSYASLVASFPLVAPSLRHFSLQSRPSPDLVATFSGLAKLQHLACHFAVDLGSVLDALPQDARPRAATLRTLSIELEYDLAPKSALLAPRIRSLPALAALEELHIPRAPAMAEFRAFGGEELLEACEERGVKVVIGQAVAWRTRLFVD